MDYVIHYTNAKDPLVAEAGAEIKGSPKETFMIRGENDLTDVPGPVLAALWNRANPKSPVKKFSERRVGAKKVYPILKKLVGKGPAKKTAAKSKTAAPKKGKKAGIGARVNELLLKGKDTDAILEVIAKEFPDSGCNRGNVSWYRSKLRKEGQL